MNIDASERARRVVRERAAELVAGLGPAALEIIAEFRADRWQWVAMIGSDLDACERASARSAEWCRIAKSVSLLLIWGRGEPSRDVLAVRACAAEYLARCGPVELCEWAHEFAAVWRDCAPHATDAAEIIGEWSRIASACWD